VIIRRIFEEYVAGKSMTAIVRALHSERIPTARGGTWHQVTVSQILRNRLYIGEVIYDGESYEGLHEAIISRDLFEQAQALRAARPSKGRGRPTTGKHLFRKGLLRCGLCGAAMVPRTTRGHEVYYCDRHSKLGHDECPMLYVKRVDVDTAVYAYFEKVGLDVEATRAQVASARDGRLTQIRALIKDATRAEREATEALARVKRDYMNGALSVEDWNEMRLELTEERDGAKAALDRLHDQEREVASWSDVHDAEAETLKRLAEIRAAIADEVSDTDGIDAVRAAFLRLFERFVVHVDRDTKDGRIDAIVRRDAIRTVEGEDMHPVLYPTPLEIAGENQRVGSATR
jgi:site-specific DNA recombinase